MRTQPGVTGWFRNTPASNQRFDQSLDVGFVHRAGFVFQGPAALDHRAQPRSVAARARIWPLEPTRQRTRSASSTPPATSSRPTACRSIPFATNWVTNQVYGGVFKVTPWLALTGTYQESSLFTDNFGTDLFGKPLKPRSGHGEDYGVRFTWDTRLHASFVYYDNVNENVPLPGLSAAVQNEMRALVGSVLAGNVDTKDEASRGIEFEVTTNFTAQLDEFAHVFAIRGPSGEHLRAAQDAPPGGARYRQQSRPESGRGDGDHDRPRAAGRRRRGRGGHGARLDPAADGQLWSPATPFLEGAVRGISLGTAVRYYDGKPRVAAIVDNVQVLPDTTTKQQLTVSPFVSYRRKIGRITWTGQVNVNNIFNRITDQGAQYRYPRFTEPRQFIYTLTAQF